MPSSLTSNASKYQVKAWFVLSLVFAATYSLLGLQQAFGSEYVVQDDVRQHVFWMQRFIDPELFPQDLIADYFQSVAPTGYTAVYQLMASFGMNPLVLNKLLPTVLGLITTGYCFGISQQLLPIPLASFLSTLLLNQALWMKDDLITATPRAFLYPLFIAFLYYLLRRSLLFVSLAIALLGLFYPHYVLVAAGILILRLGRWEKGKLRLSHNRSDYLLCATGLGVALLILLPFALESSEFGPVISAAEARTLPEFWAKGRTAFFTDDPGRFWFSSNRSGLMSEIKPPLLALGFVLPILLLYRSRFPLVQQLTSKVIILPQILVVSFTLFLAAHALLFKLHLPNRYTEHNLRIVLAISASITIIVLWDALWRWARQFDLQFKKLLALASAALLGLVILLYPILEKEFPRTEYRIGATPTVYKFFQQQPKDILIASLSEEVNNIPTFAGRSILLGREYAIPYHLGYHRQLRQRTVELIQAQYSPDLTDAQNLIQKYGLDFWLLDRVAFTPEYLADNRWLTQFQPTQEALSRLQQGVTPALSTVIKRCSVFETQDLIILQADCMKNPH